MSRKQPHITGILHFSPKRTLLRTSDGKEFFVRYNSLKDGYIQGDSVRAKCTKRALPGRLPEAEIIALVARTKNELIGTYQGGNLIPFPIFGSLRAIPVAPGQDPEEHTVYSFFIRDNEAQIVQKYIPTGTWDAEIASILLSENIPTEWTREFRDSLPKEYPHHATEIAIPKHHILAQKSIITDTLLNLDLPIARATKYNNEERMDLSNWYTLTIDSEDAKDLDDAISIAHTTSGEILLGVHIADVSFFVSSGSPLDKEAAQR